MLHPQARHTLQYRGGPVFFYSVVFIRRSVLEPLPPWRVLLLWLLHRGRGVDAVVKAEVNWRVFENNWRSHGW